MSVMKFRGQKEFFYRIRIGGRRVWKIVWPVQWRLFFKPKEVGKALKYSDYFFKLTLVVFSIGLILSTFGVYTNLYAISSYRIPAANGYIQEALLSANRADISTFNPLLTPNSESEAKITNLLYHPLYQVKLPNFNSDKIDIQITPVLLSKSPEWQDEDASDQNQRFRKLRMVLRNDLKWSDGKPMTMEDVKSTFEKLKDKDANIDFSSVLQGVNFEIVASQQNTFDLVSDRSNPFLLHTANFSPLPKDLFFNQTIQQIQTDSYSKSPTVTSGYFSFEVGENGTVTDPRNPKNEKKPNPFIDQRSGIIQTIILKRNPHQNYIGHTPYLEHYIFERFKNFETVQGQDPQTTAGLDSSSLQDSFRVIQTHFFTRSTINLDQNLDQYKVQKTLQSEQKTVDTNTFYMMFFRAQRGTQIVDRVLRQYIACSIIKADIGTSLESNLKGNLSKISSDKILLPPQIQTTKQPNCPDDVSSIITGSERKNYVFREPTNADGAKKLTSARNTTKLNLNLISTSQDKTVALKLQEVLKNAGFNIDILDKENTRIDSTSVMVLTPVVAASPNVYNLYSRRANNLVSASSNSDLNNLEDLLLNYQSSAGSSESRTKLADFFSDNFLSLNLFQSKLELNYNPKILGFKDNLPVFNSLPMEYYSSVSLWHVNQAVRSKWFDR
jgi:ABC-type transport system substrate-binding protein